MCLPIAAVAAGLAIATATVGIVQQSQIAKQQNRAIRQQYENRVDQIDDAATAEINARLREARREQGRIAVAAGQAGLNLQSGSVEALLMDSAMQAELANDQSLANRESRRTAARDDANSAFKSRPTALGAGLQIALAGGNAYLSASAGQARADRTGGGD